ncbi:hypothetical protein M9H77_07570 [Catharanthus roseus]|uniref:Uncharacterized protein n=1 Tax=Catharanthus roseus TaxID=4058 RepID=A0ACC0BVI1_CATRO|nr:hypothetical protein M9H77_07570 [Catharanthus roseus]
MLGSVTLDLDLDRGRSIVGGTERPGKYARACYLFVLTALIFWDDNPFLETNKYIFCPYGKDSDSTCARELTGHSSLMFSKCFFFPLSDDLCREARRYLTPPQLT